MNTHDALKRSIDTLQRLYAVFVAFQQSFYSPFARRTDRSAAEPAAS